MAQFPEEPMSPITKSILFSLALLCSMFSAGKARAQQATPARGDQTIASVLEIHYSLAEAEIVGAAQAMPEDKYSFAPTNGEFKGVRTFAEQVKHVAALNYRFFSKIMGKVPPTDLGDKGDSPANIKTKAQIVKFLQDSFAYGHRALATITAENALTPLRNSKSKGFDTRLGWAMKACWHPYDHYGQMAEYLRMNGIVPPASRQ